MSEEEEVVEEVPAEAPAEEQSEENPIFNALFKAVEDEPESEEEEAPSHPTDIMGALAEIEEETAQPVEEVAEEPTEEVAVKDAPAKKKKKRVARKPNVVDPDPRPVGRQHIPAPAQVEDPFVQTLSAEERERYELAKWASENVPDRKGLDGNYLSFFKNHKKYVDKRLTEDPDVELEHDEGYRKFIESNKPKVNVKELEHARISSQAEANAMNKLAPEIARLEKQQKAMAGGPVAQQRFESSKVHFRNAIPKDLQGEFSKDPAAFSRERPFETKIVNSVLEDAFAMAQSFYNILHEVEEYNEQNPAHVGLSQWIDKEQTDFINSGKTKKDGKVFIRRERYPEVSEAEREKYYTFTDDEVIQLLALRVNQNISGKLNHLNEQLSSAGYSRNGAAAPQTPVVQEPARTPQPVQPSPRPGPSAPTQPTPEKNSILSLLDM